MGRLESFEPSLDSPRRVPCLTLIRMHDVVPVRITGQFAEDLMSAGFREVRRPPLRRGGVEPVLTLVATGGGLAADAAAILLAKDAAEDFLVRLRPWMAPFPAPGVPRQTTSTEPTP